MSKRQNKRNVTKQIRKALNKSLDFLTRAGGRRLTRIGYSTGLAGKNMRDTTKGNEE